MARNYTRADFGDEILYHSEAGRDEHNQPVATRLAKIEQPTATAPASALVTTRDEQGVFRHKGGLTIEQAHFVARTFVEWDGGDHAFVVQH